MIAIIKPTFFKDRFFLSYVLYQAGLRANVNSEKDEPSTSNAQPL
jgi:hypothetical protein